MSFTAPSIQWAGLVPVLIILGAAILGVLIEAFMPRRARHLAQTMLAVLAILGAIVAIVWRWSVVVDGRAPGYPVVGFNEDNFGIAAQGVLLIIGLLSILVISDRTEIGDSAFAAQAADRPGSAEESESIHAGWVATEAFPLTLFSLAGMMLFPVVSDLISLFVMLELVSLPLYVMAAMARHRRLLSQEAAMKYFVLGAFASAFLLMGSALLYGASGSVLYNDLQNGNRIQPGVASAVDGAIAGVDWLVLAGVALVLVGLLFKIAAAPFHAWSPDVYQGAPTPVTGFMAAGVKATAFLALVRFFYMVGGGLSWDLAPVLWTIAILTMVVGTVVGIVQRDVKRMLAYSAIAHAGYMLIGIIAYNQRAITAILFYSLAYGIATVGAFGVVSLVRESHGGGAGAEATGLDDYRGLARRSPWLAAAMTFFLLSFAGIPLTGGFIAKFQLFVAGIDGGATWLVVIAVASSAATAFFYLRLVVLMYFRAPEGEGVTVVDSQGTAAAALTFAVLATIALGVLPQAALTVLGDAAMLIP
ncbi:NADH-quinone oxidoreductase subunit NuoN [Actinomyces gaoshouyii]|uniref:NADH-quinone oxidoreductase subunit N n=1 Tax=Actinomyces gaoshouyii TaxID=1960083 RepID=A0A8H9HC48_9ACTO|nr:NADH-quinone oxidoreductase subunit NuoN [Actinomyces gaoshouyii]GGO95966.1 NADH-quinone oxidoreductase subunit N [Actinomyces gaoshouyii]